MTTSLKCSICTYVGPEVTKNSYERGSVWDSYTGSWTGPKVTAHYAPTCKWCDERAANATEGHDLYWYQTI